MLHLLNGDATAAVFCRVGLPGDTAVWRDVLVEGPVTPGAVTPAAMPGRAAYLAERLDIDPEEYGRVSRAQEAALAEAAEQDEVVLSPARTRRHPPLPLSPPPRGAVTRPKVAREASRARPAGARKRPAREREPR